MRYSNSGWFSCDSTIDLYISESELEKDDSERKLFIIGKQILENGEVDLKKGPDDTIAFEVILFDANNSSHWTKVFDDCIYNFKGGNTRHCHMALIWALYRTAWSEAMLSQALGNMDKNNMSIVTNFQRTQNHILWVTEKMVSLWNRLEQVSMMKLLT